MNQEDIDKSANRFTTPEMRALARQILEGDSNSESWMEAFGFYRLSDLTEEEKRPPEFIVDGMIPCGMSFLAGAPKIRKSFFALQMAFAVARGIDFLGHHTMQADVLYFDLEGSKSRISTRAERMLIDKPDNLLITNRLLNKITNLGERSLVDDLAELMKYRPSTKLIIIDTYSRARGKVSTGGANSYDVDVELLEPYQRFAIDSKVALLFVHHDKKGAGLMSDSFERLSGTMGISGSADSVLNLVAEGKRFDGKASLEYNPRDAQGGEKRLFFDTINCIWRVDEAPAQTATDTPLARFCIEHAPERNLNGEFFSYNSIQKAVSGYSVESPGEKISHDAKAIRSDLYNEYGICLQTGVKYGGNRGIRIIQC